MAKKKVKKALLLKMCCFLTGLANPVVTKRQEGNEV
jgi:hypothetical protein